MFGDREALAWIVCSAWTVTHIAILTLGVWVYLRGQ